MFSFRQFHDARTYTDRRAPRVEDVGPLAPAGADRAGANATFYAGFRGLSVAEVGRLALEWYVEVRRAEAGLFHANAIAELRSHQARGGVVVLVSGSFREVLAPLAAELGAGDVLATDLEVEDGRFTGRILPPQMIGAGKALAVAGFLRARGCDPGRCYAYGDHESDLPMLRAVGHPIAVGSDEDLLRHARAQGWPMLRDA
jgi:HAD superfamily hydrolase (TIGR01490 family)